MPIVLKTQHQHSKKKSNSVIDVNIIKPKQNALDLQKSAPNILTIEQPKKIQEVNKNVKQVSLNNQTTVKQKQKQSVPKPSNPIKSNVKSQIQERNKIQVQKQKTLNVQIIKKNIQSSQNANKNKNISSEPNISITNVSEKQQKKSKKKKNKKIQQPQEQIPYQLKLAQRVKQLHNNFINKHNIRFNHQYPEFMNILMQSFTQFAKSQLQQQQKIKGALNQPDPNIFVGTEQFNPVHQYNQYLFDYLKKRKTFHQDRIYLGVLEQNHSFNDLIWREQVQSKPKKQQVASLFNNIHLFVINDVWDGQYEIKPKQKASKDEIIYGSYKANQIRMAQSIIKQKLNNLHDQLLIDGPQISNQNQRQNPPQQYFNNHKKYDLNSQQTKKAQQFIKKLQQQDKILKQKLRKQKQIQQEQQIKRLEQRKQIQFHLKQQKLKQRRAKLQQKALQRQKYKQQRTQSNQKYVQYLNKNRQKTPLYKKKEQDFKAVLIKQHLRKLQLMKQVQSKKRIISKDQIQLHQMKYKELKDLLQEQRRQMLKLEQQKWDQTNQSHYKSKFHTSIMNQLYAKTIDQENRSKAQQLYTRKVQYSTIVKTNFAPKIDSRKKQELQRLIKDISPKPKDDNFLAQKIKMEGQRNLQRLHRFVGSLRAKGKVRKHQTPPADFQLVSKKPRYTNYLEDIKTSRMKISSSMRKSRFTSLDMSKMNRNSMGLIQIQAKNLQQSADRKSLYLKNTKNLDIEQYLTKKFELEDDYMESARVKVSMIKKYQGDDENELSTVRQNQSQYIQKQKQIVDQQ